MDAFGATLSTQPRLFYPTERCSSVRDETRVEPHHSGLQFLDHSVSTIKILGEDVAHQAVFRVVRNRDGFILIGETDDAKHWSENFLAQNGSLR